MHAGCTALHSRTPCLTLPLLLASLLTLSAHAHAHPRVVPLLQLHAQLNGVVGTLNEKVAAVLQKQEKEFLRAYRSHMYTIQKELQALRAKADDAAIQLAKNEKIRALEAERDWYRGEALRLDSFCASLKGDVELMRDKLAAIEEDRAWLESQLKGSKRSNQLLRAELEETAVTSASAQHTHQGFGGSVGSGFGGRHQFDASPPGSEAEEGGGVHKLVNTARSQGTASKPL